MLIIDETYRRIIDPKIRGRKPKYRLDKVQDGILKRYIFKYGAINNEIFAELLAEQLGKQMGIEMAHYVVADDGKNIGVLTDNFLVPGEYLCSSDTIKENIESISSDSGLYVDMKDNTIENVVRSACTYDSEVDFNKLLKELIKRWIFYSIIIESDKNSTNIAFIKGSGVLRISPDYDNASMALLNNNIDSYLDSIRSGVDIYRIIDSVKNNFCLRNGTNSNFYDDLRYLFTTYHDIISEIIPYVKQINVDAAIEIVEKDNEVSVPWNVRYWVGKVVNARVNDVMNMYEEVVVPNMSPGGQSESTEPIESPESDVRIYVLHRNGPNKN